MQPIHDVQQRNHTTGIRRRCETLISFVRYFQKAYAVGWTSKPAIGGAGRDRTDDLLLAKQALSQLSYSPVPTCNGGPGKT